MQLQDIVGRIRKTLGEVETAGYGTQADGVGSWDNSQIIGYINEALSMMSHDWRKEKVGSIPIATVGQTDFAFPADMLEDGLRKVYYTTGGINYPVHFIDLDVYSERAAINNSQGISNYFYAYTVWAGLIKLFPGAASATDTITPYYYRFPATLALATDVPEIPARFHTALVFYGIMECQNAVEETGLESDVEQKWIQELNLFRMEMARNQRDQGVRARRR